MDDATGDASRPEARIGLFLSDEEGGAELSLALTQAGYQVVRLGEAKVWAPDQAATHDALVLTQVEAGRLKAVLDMGEREKKRVALPLLVLASAKGAFSAPALEGWDEDVTLVPQPVDPGYLLFQLQAALRRRRRQDDLKNRLRAREEVLRSISEVFFSVNNEYRYTFFNEKAQRVGGKTHHELIGKNMWDVYPFLRGTDFQRNMEEAARERKIVVSEYLGPITGEWFEMRIYPSETGLSVLFVDISGRKKAEEALRDVQRELERANVRLERAVGERTAQLHAANEQLEELIYSIAHDLRSPLRTMEGYAQAFLEDFSPGLGRQAHDYARRMTEAALFMDRMLKDLLELTRVTKSEIALEPVAVAPAWEAAQLQHEREIRDSGARITTALELGRVAANPTLLTQILANLLGNALKFRQNGVTPEIKLWTEMKPEGCAVIYLQDNGIGIDPRFHDRIFRVFERLHGSAYQGTGIGLAIAKKAAERMQGQLSFTSALNAGTTFRLELAPG